MLRNLGVEFAQGYSLGQPYPLHTKLLEVAN
jgi:EAL domain-containing protein (putative c-di-GMP-specific phosphodiesterase class I)